MKEVTMGKMYKDIKTMCIVSGVAFILGLVTIFLYCEYGDWDMNDFTFLLSIEILITLVLGISVGLYAFTKAGLKHKLFKKEQILP